MHKTKSILTLCHFGELRGGKRGTISRWRRKRVRRRKRMVLDRLEERNEDENPLSVHLPHPLHPVFRLDTPPSAAPLPLALGTR